MQRRCFLAALSASALTAPQLSHSQTSSPQGLTLGFSTYGAKTMKTERIIDLLAKLGYDSLEITIWPGWDLDSAATSAQRRKTLRKQLQDRGLRLTSLMEHLHIDEKHRTAAQRIERVKRAAELAHDLSPQHPPLLQTTLGGGGDWRKVRQRYAEELQQWLKAADAGDLTIAVKPHRGGAFSRPSEAAELAKMLDHPQRLRMCYDFSHYDFRDMTLEETIRDALPHVAHIAVKDVIQEKTGRTRFVLPGEGGRIDYPKMLRLFYEGGYRGDVCSEVSGQVWSRPGYHPIKTAETCYDYLAAAFVKSRVPRKRRH